MEQRKVHIDNLYREKQEQFVELPAFAWDKMEQTLDASKDRRRIAPWIWYALLIALLALVCYIAFKTSHAEQHRQLNPSTFQSTGLAGNNRAASKSSPIDRQEKIITNTAPAQHAGGNAKQKQADQEPVLIRSDAHAKPNKHDHDRVANWNSNNSMAGISTRSNDNEAADQSKQPFLPEQRNNNATADNTEVTTTKNEHNKEGGSSTPKEQPSTEMQDMTSQPGVLKTKTPKDSSSVGKREELKVDNISSTTVPKNSRQSEPSSHSEIAQRSESNEAAVMSDTQAISRRTGKELIAGRATEAKQTVGKKKKAGKRKNDNSAEVITNAMPDNHASDKPNLPEEKKGTVFSDDTRDAKGIPIDSSSESTEEKKPEDTRPKRSFKLFELGLKAGYEVGLQSNSINKFSAGPYVQYNLSKRLSVVVQPAIRSGKAKGIVPPQSQAYYSQTGTTVDSILNPAGGRIVWLITYHHKYDSIVVNYQSKTQVTEFEIPVLLQYNLPGGFGFSAGVNFITGTLASITETQKLYNNLEQTDTFERDVNVVFPPPDTSNSFHHTALPFSSYVPVGPSTTSNPLRIGYILGVRYSRQRWLAEVSVHQTISGLSNISNTSLKQGYSQPYFRFALGYRLIK